MGLASDSGIKAILFDIDGTLYPKRMLNVRMLRSMFPSLVLSLRYNRMRKRIRQVQEVEPTVPPTREGFRRRQAAIILKAEDRDGTVSENTYGRVEKRLEHQFYDRWEQSFKSIKAFPGMRDALVRAREQGLRLGVLSDFPIADKLKTLRIDDVIEYACCTEDAGYLKPHPAPFLYILGRMGLSAQDVLFVGDSYDKDIVGAHRVGMRSCLIKPGYGAGQRHGLAATKKYPLADLVCGTWPEFSEKVLGS